MMPQTTRTTTDATVLGMGEMGHALATSLLKSGHTVTVWNRTSAKAHALVDTGARIAPTVKDAVASSPLVVTCLLDTASVLEQLEPSVDALTGRTLVNLTTATPAEARDLADWARRHDIDFVDGGIMATPDMIGQPGSMILYSGDALVIGRHRPLLEVFGEATYVGQDPGAAALFDTAMLGAMYAMFAGFELGGRMVRTGGGSAAELAAMLTPFLQAMAATLEDAAKLLDEPGVHEPIQSVEFTRSAIDLLIRSAEGTGQSGELLLATRALLTGD